jgi:N-acetyl sugar amidotransferase
MVRNYQICSRCVMDTTDPDIVFDESGVCHHCQAYDAAVRSRVFTGETGRRALLRLVETIRRLGRGKDYDCVIGVSGGVDSTYVAYKVKELGLRPLAVHLDNGWDSELAVKNIEQTLTRLKINLHTHVIDWEEFRDLQLAFLKASTPDSEIPTDHAIVSLMRQTAARLGLSHVIFGCNVRSESHLPSAWSQGHWDWRYIKSVHELFGTVPLRTFPHTHFIDHYRYRMSQQWIDILNYLDYVKDEAKTLLIHELGWRDYGGKHFESIYTRFYQGHILPKKFGYDKRRTHFSSLICSGEMTRAQGLEDLREQPYPVDQQVADREYVIKKLGITSEAFDEIMRLPPKSYWDYPSYGCWLRSPIYRWGQSLYRLLKRRTAR